MCKPVAGSPGLWRSATPDDTEAFGAQLARALPPTREALILVALCGDLGAGKTTLARGFLHAAGIPGAVRSPTYTLLEAYDLPGVPQSAHPAAVIVHLDLYRLRDPAELEPLGLRDLAVAGNVWLVEWAERGEGWLPLPDIQVRLSVAGVMHEIAVTGVSALGRAWVARLAR